jgi:hypothetical protein
MFIKYLKNVVMKNDHVRKNIQETLSADWGRQNLVTKSRLIADIS